MPYYAHWIEMARDEPPYNGAMSDSSYCPNCASELPAGSNFCERCDEEVKPLSSVRVVKHVGEQGESDKLSGWVTFLFSLIIFAVSHIVGILLVVIITLAVDDSVNLDNIRDFTLNPYIGFFGAIFFSILMVWALWKPNRWLSKLISRNIKRLFRRG